MNKITCDTLINIDSARQTLTLTQDNALKVYPISTGLKGMGEQEGSEKTPRGWHEICEKIGDGMPENTVFVAREATGEIYSPELAEMHPGRDWILTRILRLKGLEPGRNQGPGVDSFERYIYIHGTPDTTRLGREGSRGCIRMKNSNLVELFDSIKCGCKVFIE